MMMMANYNEARGVCLVFDTSALIESVDGLAFLECITANRRNKKNNNQSSSNANKFGDINMKSVMAVIPRTVLEELRNLSKDNNMAKAKRSKELCEFIISHDVRKMQNTNNTESTNDSANVVSIPSDNTTGAPPAYCTSVNKCSATSPSPSTATSVTHKKHNGITIQRKREVYRALQAFARNNDTVILACAMYFAIRVAPNVCSTHPANTTCQTQRTNNANLNVQAASNASCNATNKRGRGQKYDNNNKNNYNSNCNYQNNNNQSQEHDECDIDNNRETFQQSEESGVKYLVPQLHPRSIDYDEQRKIFVNNFGKANTILVTNDVVLRIKAAAYDIDTLTFSQLVKWLQHREIG